MKSSKVWSLVIVVVVLVSFASIEKSLASIVVPNQFTNEADLSLAGALNCALNPNGTRTQTLFPGDEFIDGTILGFTSRLFPGSPGINQVPIPNITIKMSTTTVSEGNLSNIFADNVGADETTVFQGTVVFNAPACNTIFPVACPFPEPLLLQTPFPFNPSNGNLLVETIIPPCVGGVPADVEQDVTGDLMSIFSDNSQSNSGQSTGGFITEFKFQPNRPIPTLSEWGLIAMAGFLGIIGTLAIRRKKEVT